METEKGDEGEAGFRRATFETLSFMQRRFGKQLAGGAWSSGESALCATSAPLLSPTYMPTL